MCKLEQSIRAYTDSNGFYSFSWLYPGHQTLLVSKEGYRTPLGQPDGSFTMTVTGDTRLDIQLVRRDVGTFRFLFWSSLFASQHRVILTRR